MTSTHTLLRCDKNFVVVIGFEVLKSGKAENVAAVIERAAQHTLGKSVKEVINSACSDGAALKVAQWLERTAMKVIHSCLYHDSERAFNDADGL